TLIHGFDGLEGRKPRFPRIPERVPEPVEQSVYPPLPRPSWEWPPSSTKRFKPLDGPLAVRELPHIQLATVSGSRPTHPEYWLTDAAIRTDIEREHCWVYILRYADGDIIPQRIIAQGTLDSQIQSGFRLFGARYGDSIALIGT